jgi:hypothetical protein
MLFRDIRLGLRNLKLWFPLIWKDRQWDHYYLFKMLRMKLKLMEQFFRENAMHLGAEKDAKGMKVCVLLLDRLIEDNYLERAERCLPGRSLLSFDRSEYRKEIKRKLWVERANMLSHQDLDYLGKIINKHSLSWWD